MTRFRARAVEDAAADAPVGAARLIAPSKRAEEPAHSQSRKFRIAVGALVALAIISIGLALSLTASGSSSKSSGAAWSEWSPTQGGLAGAQEIADFLSPYYRATPAYQLAVVTPLNLNDTANPVAVVLPSANSASGVQALSASSTVAYNLCGLGSNDCSIGVGTPSANRLKLLRREALELALYTFKYIHGVQNVVAILPPGHSVQTTCTGICPTPHPKTASSAVDLAVAFDRHELQPWLDRPLRATLPEPLPPTVSEIPNAPESELVDVITAQGLFQVKSETSQDGTRLLVLTPMPPQ